MDNLLQTYLAAHPFHHETIEQWPVQGAMRVRLSLGSALPPAHVSSSILSIVMKAERQVLFLWPATPTGSILHLVIGGRPEGGETPQETAIREVGEETGWRIKPIRMIGFRHFFHLEPRVENTDRPYPDFIQPIYAGAALSFDPDLVIANDLMPAEFLPFAQVEQQTDPAQRPLLYAAVDAIGDAVTNLSTPTR